MVADRLGCNHCSVWRITLFGPTRPERNDGCLCVRQPNQDGVGSVPVYSLHSARGGYLQYKDPSLKQGNSEYVLQVDQEDLGVSGGLSGVARNGGGVVALTVCRTILTNVQASNMKQLVPPAAIAAGLPLASVEAQLGALPLGEAALLHVPGVTEQVLGAALAAWKVSYVVAIR